MRQTIYSIPPILKIVIYIVLFLFLLVTSVQATTFIVDKTSGNFSDISSAIYQAKDGDTILVNSGIYYENVHISKSLRLVGRDIGRGQPIIDGMQKDFAIGIHGNDIWVEGFVVTNCTQDPRDSGLGIFIGSNGIYIPKRNTVINNTAVDNSVGIGVYFAQDSIIQGNIVQQNRDGINLNHGINISVVNNTIDYHNNGGIYSGNFGGNNLILGNKITHCAIGILLDESDSNLLEDNSIYDSGNSALVVSKSKGNIIKNNLINLSRIQGLDIASNSVGTIVDSNQFSYCDKWGVFSHNSSQTSILNNHISYSNGGIGLHLSSNSSLLNNQLNEIQKYDGILLERSSNGNTVINNTISNSKGGAIHLSSSNDNVIYLNNFNIEYFTILESSSNNSWLSPDPIEYHFKDQNFSAHLGNYWKGYQGQDLNNDGIGDTPYHAAGDTAPLFGEWDKGSILGKAQVEESPSIQLIPDFSSIFSIHLLVVVAGVIVLLSVSWYARDTIKSTFLHLNQKIKKYREKPIRREEESVITTSKAKVDQTQSIVAANRTTHHDVFISYSNVDKPTADAVCAHLERNNIRCWIAPRDVLPGQNFLESIIDAIDQCRIMILIFSSHSNNSPHVIRELTRALKREAIIIPFRIENIEPSKSMEYLISVPHWLDAITPPLEQYIVKLTEIVQMLITKQ